MPMSPDLVIFDCDGVIVDSERLTCEVLADALRGFGLDKTTQEVMNEFVGGTLANVVTKVAAEGITLPERFLDDVYDAMFARLARDVEAVPGIETVIDALDAARLPYCIASNGPMTKMEITLGKTGLKSRFAPHIFSAHEVGLDKAKPHPGLFLHAAHTMGVAPARTVVIEDSLSGAKAAKAAQMRCFGYAAESDAAALAGQDAQVFYDMHKLPKLLGL